MAQRFTLDSRSFEQFLAAASLLQQFQRQASQAGGPRNFAHHLFELLETQKSIESGTLDTDVAIERIVRLALRVLGGEGTAVWLFSNEEFVYRAGSGRSAANDERLRLTVLARVAAICEPSRESFPGQRAWAKGAADSGYYPGCARSVIVGPIYRNQIVVGALAAFSSEFDAFDQRDAANIRLLSGLIGSAMDRAIVPDRKSVALPRQTLLRVIEHIVPAIERLVHEQDSARQSVSPSLANREPALTEAPIEQPQAELVKPLENVQDEEVPSLALSEATQIESPAVSDPEVIVPAATQTEEETTSTTRELISMSEQVPTVDEIQEQPAAIVQSSAESLEDPERVTAALREELAQLSRSIAKIEDKEAESVEAPEPEELLATENQGSESAASEMAPQGFEEAGAPLPMTFSVNEVTQETAQANIAEEPQVMHDTSVPGIGVRAALYDDEEEQPSQLWTWMRQAAAGSANGLRQAVGRSLSAAKDAVSWAAAGTQHFGTQLRKSSDLRLHLPKFPGGKLTRASRSAWHGFTTRSARALGWAQGLTHREAIPKSSENRSPIADQSGRWLSRSASSVGSAFRNVVNSLPDLPTLSLSDSRDRLRRSKMMAATVHGVEDRASRLRSYRLRIRVNGLALRRSASALAILLVMGAFLLTESGLFRSDSTAAASARSQVQNKNAASPQLGPAVPASMGIKASNTAKLSATPVHSGPSSHLTVTDPSTEDIVQNLTRFEVSTLRRQAESGDEEAAFQLGMVYEIGYDMQQNCQKAAQWVSRAAEAGYAPAEYNLGLRYRDGDGVAANTGEAEMWLNKAAAHKYRPARVALATLIPQER